jgi:hypothetical protein
MKNTFPWYSCSGLGNCFFSTGDYARARELHEQDRAIAEALGDRAGVATACDNLGDCMSSTGEYMKAISYFETQCRSHVVVAGASRRVLPHYRVRRFHLAASLNLTFSLVNSSVDFNGAWHSSKATSSCRKRYGKIERKRQRRGLRLPLLLGTGLQTCTWRTLPLMRA